MFMLPLTAPEYLRPISMQMAQETGSMQSMQP